LDLLKLICLIKSYNAGASNLPKAEQSFKDLYPFYAGCMDENFDTTITNK